MTNINNNLLSQEARANIYKILSIYYYEPEEELIREDFLAFLKSQLRVVCPEAQRYVEHIQESLRFEKNKIGDLLIDYARLFVGPFELLAPPYGSVYIGKERRVMSESTEDAFRCYQFAGLELDQNIPEPPDHIAFELEFMHYLVFQDMKESNNESGVQKYFLENHLGSWIEDFTKRIEKYALSVFFLNLAQITRIFVKNDQFCLLNQ